MKKLAPILLIAIFLFSTGCTAFSDKKAQQISKQYIDDLLQGNYEKLFTSYDLSDNMSESTPQIMETGHQYIQSTCGRITKVSYLNTTFDKVNKIYACEYALIGEKGEIKIILDFSNNGKVDSLYISEMK